MGVFPFAVDEASEATASVTLPASTTCRRERLNVRRQASLLNRGTPAEPASSKDVYFD
jgi:hypothetical protein